MVKFCFNNPVNSNGNRTFYIDDGIYFEADVKDGVYKERAITRVD